jgi:hypothetical protein
LTALLALLFSSPVAMGDEITLPFTFAKPAGDSHFPQWSSFTIVRASDLSLAKLENVTLSLGSEAIPRLFRNVTTVL